MCIANWDLQKKSSFADSVLQWGRKNSCDFPWRLSPSPYRILVAEVLLKRTTATAAARVYENFLARFPSLRSVQSAPEEELVLALSSLGLQNQRARSMKHLADWLLSKHDGEIPGDLEVLLKVPGLGDYSATAILSFGHGVSTAILDVNVERILLRAFGNTLPTRTSANLLRELAQYLLPIERHREYNYGLLDLGRRICRYTNPRCGECPIATICDFNKVSSRKGILPVKAEKEKARQSKLREIRRNRGMSLKRLAEIARVSKLTVIRIEAGKTCPRRGTLEKLGNALQVCPDELL